MKIFETIFWDEPQTIGGVNQKNTQLFGSLFFAVISLALTVMNIVNGYSLMALATSLLIVGFVIAYILAFLDKCTGSRIAMTTVCVVLFTYFALSGGNDGFAILWILLVPVVSSLLLGLKFSFFLNLYFQIFLIVLFYTPLSDFVKDYYTETFMVRFPILFFTDFIAIIILMCQRQNLNIEIQKQFHFDPLTNIHNRRYYSDLCEKLEKNEIDPDLIIFSMDLNLLKETNDTLGHDAGDEVIREAARLVSEAFVGDECCRTGGDEFVVISTRKDALQSVDTLKESMEQWHGKLVDKMNMSIGYAAHADYSNMTLEELTRVADKKMYIDKYNYYNAAGIDRRRR